MACIFNNQFMSETIREILSGTYYTAPVMYAMLPACLYFINLLNVPASQNLFDQPMFWINVGLLFTFSCILPLNILEFFSQKYLFANFDLYYINYVSYAINYFFIARAYACKRREPMDLTSLNLLVGTSQLI